MPPERQLGSPGGLLEQCQLARSGQKLSPLPLFRFLTSLEVTLECLSCGYRTHHPLQLGKVQPASSFIESLQLGLVCVQHTAEDAEALEANDIAEAVELEVVSVKSKRLLKLVGLSCKHLQHQLTKGRVAEFRVNTDCTQHTSPWQ